MTTRPSPSTETEEFWRDFLTRGDSKERRSRRVFKRIPRGPRCRLCAAPFDGIGAPVMHILGRDPSTSNPTMCNSCFSFLTSHNGGAEIECTMLFADIRGSTALAEGMSAGGFRQLLDRFYTVASASVFRHDGIVDKFVGDELVALFFPLLSGDRHAEQAVAAAQDLLRATGHADSGGPWVPLGAGVHTALAWFGAIGQGSHVELTAVGDAVNTTARLAAVASAGEILVTTEAAAAAALEPTLERRHLDLKGKQQVTDVLVLRVDG